MGTGLRVALLAAALSFAVVASPSDVYGQSADPAAVDPVVGDVVRMLEVGIDPELVLAWLESSGKRPGPLSADDVIALSQAKAPKELIQALLDLSASPPAPAPPQTRTLPPTPVTPTPVPAAPPASESTATCCLVDVSVEYRVAEDMEGEETEQPERDLFLYLDGEFLARVQSQGNIAAKGPATFKARMAPGEHTLRLTRERHTLVGKSGAWRHETTVSPSVIGFEVKTGAEWNLDVRWSQSEFSTRKPLSWRWSRDGVQIAGEEQTGAYRERWAFLCEDVEASRDSGAISKWRANDWLDDCASWSQLWPRGAATERDQVLADLRAHDFAPPVQTVGRFD